MIWALMGYLPQLLNYFAFYYFSQLIGVYLLI
jgi:hypothetical protein